MLVFGSLSKEFIMNIWPNNKKFAVSLTFDDGTDTQAQIALPLLEAVGIKSSFFIYTGWEAAARNIDAWRHAHALGHEIGNHTENHKQFYSNWQSAATEISNAEQWILKNVYQDFENDHSFTHPCGQYVIGDIAKEWGNLPHPISAEARQARLVGLLEYAGLLNEVLPFASTGDEGVNLPQNIMRDRYHLLGQAVQSFEQAKAAVIAAKKVSGWSIIRFHDIGDSGILPTSLVAFQRFLEYLVSQDGAFVAPVIKVARHLESKLPNAPWECLHRL